MSGHVRRLIVLLVLAAGVPQVSQAATFRGRCVGSGLVQTGSPLTIVPTRTSISFTSSGTCSGTLDGRAIRNASYAGRSVARSALLACLGGHASGDTTLSIQSAPGQWTALHLHFDDVNVLGTSLFVLRGAVGGLGWGQHQLTPDASLLAACVGGGTDEVGNTVSLAAVTPLEG